jgi:2-methylcitrate dehydratase PrpD
MPFCAAAAVVHGHPTISTFDEMHIMDARVQALMPRVSMRVNTAFDEAVPLSQSTVASEVRDGRTLSQHSDGARGYPGRLSEAELGAKFLGCARRSLSEPEAEAALAAVRELAHAENVSGLTRACATRS